MGYTLRHINEKTLMYLIFGKIRRESKMDEKSKEFEEVCKPVIDFLRKYYNPMCKAVISDGFSEVVISDIGVPNEVQD